MSTTVVLRLGVNTYATKVENDGTVKVPDPHGFLFPIGTVAPAERGFAANPDREGVHPDAPGLRCEWPSRVAALRYLVGLALATGHRIAER